MPTGPKRKIVFVLPTLLAGGAERVLITLMNGLDRSRFSAELIVMNGEGTLHDIIDPAIPVHILGNLKIHHGLFKLAAKLNEIAPDIIISTMAAMNFGVLLVKPLLNKKAKIIVREAVIPSSIINNQKTPWLVKMAYRTLYPHADLVIAPAQCIIDEFKDDLGMTRCRYAVLHNPVSIAGTRSGRLPARDNPQRIEFICAGRLHAQKGFDRLIGALPKLQTPYDWRLTILGEGAERDNLQRLIDKNGLASKVTLSGLVRMPWPQIGAADVFLLPSRWEGLPNVVLESLSAGTPVIAMREAGGIEEIASLSPPGSILITDTMAQFIVAMSAIKPRPEENYRPSLLPEAFFLENTIRKFSQILNQTKN